MNAIEIAHRRGWYKLWLECDSSLVVKVFDHDDVIPW